MAYTAQVTKPLEMSLISGIEDRFGIGALLRSPGTNMRHAAFPSPPTTNTRCRSGVTPPSASQRRTRSEGMRSPKAGDVAWGIPSHPSMTTSVSTSRMPVRRTWVLGSAPKSPVSQADSTR